MSTPTTKRGEHKARHMTAKDLGLPATRCQVIYEDPAEGWKPTNLGIFESAEEARESAGHWATGYRTRGQGEPRMALQELKPQPLPEGAVLI